MSLHREPAFIYYGEPIVVVLFILGGTSLLLSGAFAPARTSSSPTSVSPAVHVEGPSHSGIIVDGDNLPSQGVPQEFVSYR